MGVGELALPIGVLATLIAIVLHSVWPEPPPPAVIAIDLGTTYSSVAYFRNGHGPELIADSLGRRVFPSVVAFTESGVLVGHEAQAQAIVNPKNTIFDAKRFIGKQYDDPTVQRDIGEYLFKIVNASGKPAFQVTLQGKEKIYTPEDISSILLSKMKAIAEQSFKRKVTRAVLAVPVEFNEAQRNATRIAAASIHLETLAVISEPTAAAMAFKLHKNVNINYILVFDFGGGTLDVSLLWVSNSVFEVLAISGDPHLGGEDFTHNLVNLLVSQVAVLKHRKPSSATDMQQLRKAAEELKIRLSVETQANVTVSLFDEKMPIELSVTRSEFEEINDVLFARAQVPVMTVLQEVGISKGSVDEVVLVGGSSRMPRVRNQLASFFGKQPNISVNPEEAVAEGAAMHAGLLTDSWPISAAAVERVRSKKESL